MRNWKRQSEAAPPGGQSGKPAAKKPRRVPFELSMACLRNNLTAWLSEDLTAEQMAVRVGERLKAQPPPADLVADWCRQLAAEQIDVAADEPARRVQTDDLLTEAVARALSVIAADPQKHMRYVAPVGNLAMKLWQLQRQPQADDALRLARYEYRLEELAYGPFGILAQEGKLPPGSNGQAALPAGTNGQDEQTAEIVEPVEVA